ncbi:hypothetical protein A3K69_08660 [Candidatus Bathyarchaeota archaeon RBG_16_57_9]|nr:MAG: hypothetical protein A3K69_08660 [Candidatus Bathyarchaeota archaeon RBG_16_57_9]
MPEPTTKTLPLFADTKLRVSPDDYVVISLPPSAEAWARNLKLEPFSSVTRDQDEVSLVVKAADWARYGSGETGAKAQGPYTLITFDIKLDLSVVGYLSVVSSLLADNDISIFAVSTYLRDHILVRKGDSCRAVGLLNGLLERSKGLLLKK